MSDLCLLCLSCRPCHYQWWWQSMATKSVTPWQQCCGTTPLPSQWVSHNSSNNTWVTNGISRMSYPHARTNARTHARTHACTHAHTYTHTDVLSTHTHTSCLHTHIRLVYAYMCAHTHTHTHARAHTHILSTHTQTLCKAVIIISVAQLTALLTVVDNTNHQISNIGERTWTHPYNVVPGPYSVPRPRQSDVASSSPGSQH